MLRLVGLLDYPVDADNIITFRPLPDVRAVNGVPNIALSPLARLVVSRILGVLGSQLDVTLIKSLHDLAEVCWWCGLNALPLVDEVGGCGFSVPLPTVEPLSTIVGFALAFRYGGECLVEVYSDLWPKLTDVLAWVGLCWVLTLIGTTWQSPH